MFTKHSLLFVTSWIVLVTNNNNNKLLCVVTFRLLCLYYLLSAFDRISLLIHETYFARCKSVLFT